MGVCYRPPCADTSFVPSFHDALHLITTLHPNTRIVIFGDFNFPSINWCDLAITSANKSVESDFVNTCLTFGLSQLVTSPTRTTNHSNNILDLILTSHPNSFSPPIYLDGISDHAVIHGTFQCQHKRPHEASKTITLYDKGNYLEMNAELGHFCDSFLLDFDLRSVETNWSLFKHEMRRLIAKYIPTKKITERIASPWFNTTLKRLKRKRNRQFKTAKSSANPRAWEKYRATSKKFDSLLSKTKRTFFSSTLPSLIRTNPKQFWKIINPKNTNPSVSLLDTSGNAIPECHVAEALNSSFCSVFTREPDDGPTSFPTQLLTNMSSITFSPHGISNVIDSLKLTSASGVDYINAKILKNTKHLSSIILSHIFQQSLSTGCVPQDWKIGKIVPVPKKASDNAFRPISLTCVCSKVMEHIIYTHVACFLKSVNFFHPNQHGFQKGLSCDTQLALFLSDINSNLDANTPVDAIFLDFEKAFDKVPHKRLLLKLSHLNLDAHVFAWISNFLTNRQQFVYANDNSSSLSPVLSGVPQGTVLGPLLFLLYINDLPVDISSCIRLFADDCVIYRPIVDLSDNTALHQDLRKIDEWCKKWLMVINVNKTFLMSFHRRQSYSTYNYSLNGSVISSVSSTKYLGVHISRDISWSSHINRITNDANRTLGYLRRNLNLAPPSVKLLAYETLVRPKLEFACAVWDSPQANLCTILESVQNRAARFIFSDYSYRSSVTHLKCKANLPTLKTRRKVARLCLFHKFYNTLSCGSLFIKTAHHPSNRINHSKAVYPPHARTSAYLHSFSVLTAIDWNGLPENIIALTNPARFKAAIEEYLY